MKLNCTAGSVDDSNFSKPMPVIGLYIAAAALLCAILMAIDAGKGFWSKRHWIPSKKISVNAASLTVNGVAIKLSVDLNSAMPSKVDQLAKLSTSAFICTVLANMLPSLGRLANGELLANTIALSILVITSIVNLCIQLNTGVIHAFRVAHIVMIAMMSLILHEYIATALCLPSLKRYFNFMFEETRVEGLPKLENYLHRVSALAQSSCPQFVMAGSLRSFSIAILSLVSALTFFVILIASIIHKHKFMDLNTCNGESDYKWTVLGILIAQTMAVVVGLVAPISRLIFFIGVAIEGGLLRRFEKEGDPEKGGDLGKKEELGLCRFEKEGDPEKGGELGKKEKLGLCRFEKEGYPEKGEMLDKEELELCRWQVVNGINQSLNLSYFEDRQKQSRVYLIKYVCHQLLFLFKFLCESAFTTKIIISIFPRNGCLGKNHFSPFFWHVRGEDTLTNLTEKFCSRDTQRYIDAGEKGTPQNLVNFLKQHLSCDLNGVASFLDDKNYASNDEIVKNCCWSLAVVTLTSVATSLPGIDDASKRSLMNSVNEGLVYIKLVEDDVTGEYNYMITRAAANVVWTGLYTECNWLDINLRDLACKSASPTEVLSRLAESSVKVVKDVLHNLIKEQKKSALEAFACRVAAHIMNKVCETMLQQNSLNGDTNDAIFKKISDIIGDILGACFTNLGPCIASICKRCPIENRRETVYRMLKVFGETKGIMEILAEGKRNIPDIPIDKSRFLDGWRQHFQQQGIL